MKWVKRGLWIAAWSFWAWLGFGLYRELPRQPGNVVCRLARVADAGPIGFVGKTNLVALSRNVERANSPTFIDVHDASDGRRIHSVHGPYAHDKEVHANVVQSLAHGVIVALELPHPEKNTFAYGLHVLDLTSGSWKTYDDSVAKFLNVHPTKPWAAYATTILNRDAYVRVVDVFTGEKLFDYRLPKRFNLSHRPFFFNDDRLVIVGMIDAVRTEEDSVCRYEIHRIGASSEPPDVFDGPAISRVATASLNGRIAFSKLRTAHIIEIYDLTRRQSVKFPPLDREPILDAPVIARDGKTVLGCGSLWNIDTREELWRSESWESPVADENYDSFAVYENWSGLWERILPGFSIESMARRDFATGALKWRTLLSNNMIPHFCNADGTRVAMNDGKIYALPLRFNWPLLALCQTTLALPLILLWAILRWRRKRRMRLASLQP